MWHLKERAAHNLLDIFKLELIHFYTVSLVYGDIYLFFKDFILEAELHTHTHVQKDRDKEKKRELFHLLILYPDGCISLGWVRYKAGARNFTQVLHVGFRGASTES